MAPPPIPVVLTPQGSLAELDIQEKSIDHSQDLAAASVLLVQANKARTACWLVNDSAAIMHLSLGRPAVVNQGIRLNAAGGALEINKSNLWKGDIYGISVGAANPITITEIETRYAY